MPAYVLCTIHPQSKAPSYLAVQDIADYAGLSLPPGAWRSSLTNLTVCLLQLLAADNQLAAEGEQQGVQGLQQGPPQPALDGLAALCHLTVHVPQDEWVIEQRPVHSWQARLLRDLQDGPVSLQSLTLRCDPHRHAAVTHQLAACRAERIAALGPCACRQLLRHIRFLAGLPATSAPRPLLLWCATGLHSRASQLPQCDGPTSIPASFLHHAGPPT